MPSGGLYTAALGALIGSVTNQYTGASDASPGMTAIEESVIRWMTSLFDLPESSGGVQVWLALRLHGVRRFRDELDRMLDLAERTAGRLGLCQEFS
jgi:glutamate/tyrosine decarboxylase-like PLP-dependent enzyme